MFKKIIMRSSVVLFWTAISLRLFYHFRAVYGTCCAQNTFMAALNHALVHYYCGDTQKQSSKSTSSTSPETSNSVYV